MLVVIGLENLGIRTDLSPNWGRQDRPPLLGLALSPALHLHEHSVALLHLRPFCCRRTSPARPSLPLAERLDAIAQGRKTPGPGPAPPDAGGAAFIDRDGRFGVCRTGIRWRRDGLDMRRHLVRFLGGCCGSRLGFPLGQGTRRHDHTPECLLADVTIRGLHVNPAEDTLAPPTAGDLLGPTARVCQSEWQGRVLASPHASSSCRIVQPGGRHGGEVEGFEGKTTQHVVEGGGKPGVEEVAEAIIVERFPPEPGLESREHATLRQALPHFVERRVPIQNGQH
jgi:hypothetical protein